MGCGIKGGKLAMFYVFLFYFFILFFCLLYGFCVEIGGWRLRERSGGRQEKESVSLLLVALPSQRTQPALGQYLVTCTAEQHAISY